MKSPVNWPGGKFYMLRPLLERIKEISHRTFVEVFGGGAHVTFAKTPSEIDVYNDIDEGLTNFFSVLRDKDQGEELARSLTLTPYSRREFESCEDWINVTDPTEQARQWFVRGQQSFNILFNNWSYTKSCTRRGMAKQVSAWLSAIDKKLPDCIERLRELQVECMDFEPLMLKYDSKNTLFYLDPTYIPATRIRKKTYRHEMEMADQIRLLNLLTNKIRGKVILSGYDNEYYDKYLFDWNKISIGKFVRPMGYSKSGTGNYSRQDEFIWIKEK